MVVVRLKEHLYTPHTFRCPHIFGCPHMFRYPDMFGCPHMFGCPPISLDIPICLHTPICLDTLHMSKCLTHICMPQCSPAYLCVSRQHLHIIWDGGIYTSHIECSDAITRITYKKYYKFVGKYKYLNKTPYDLYELFIYLSEEA